MVTLIGLIPNCAISIGITMMLIKGSITLGAAISGLLANGGLGLLVLFFKRESKIGWILWHLVKVELYVLLMSIKRVITEVHIFGLPRP